MIKLIVLFLIGYVFYRAIKSWMVGNVDPKQSVASARRQEIDDVMVQDPYCRTYFPQRDGVGLTVDGKTLYFCSQTCRDAYVSQNDKTNEPT